MRIYAKITNVATINTDTVLRENQPMAEFTLELRRDESGKPSKEATELKFTKMLSNLAGRDAIQIADHISRIVEDYVKTAIKGQEALDVNKTWIDQSHLINTKYTFDI